MTEDRLLDIGYYRNAVVGSLGFMLYIKLTKWIERI